MVLKKTQLPTLKFPSAMSPYDVAPRPSTLLDRGEFHFADVGRVIDEYEKQSAVAEAEKAKSIYIMRLVDDLHRYGYFTKKEAFEYLMALDATVTLTDALEQVYRAAFQEQLLMYVDHIHKLIRVGVKNMALIQDKSLYPPPPPPPPRRGFIARLLFGEE